MNCHEAHELLPLLLYGDLAAAEETLLRTHVANCATCRHELAALSGTRKHLDRVETPTVPLDLTGVYRALSRRQIEQTRHWRRITVGVCLAAAAAVLLAVGLRFEIRHEPGQLVVRWGNPPERHVPVADVPPAPPAVETRETALAQEQLVLLGQLLQTLAGEMDVRDQRARQELRTVRAQLQEIQRQVLQRCQATEQDVAALYAVQFPSTRKGPIP